VCVCNSEEQSVDTNCNKESNKSVVNPKAGYSHTPSRDNMSGNIYINLVRVV
jgi:hypothetical protein